MKVEDSNLTASSVATGRAQPSTAAAPADTARPQPARGSESGDRVELSGFAGKLGQLLSAQAATRAQRVAALARDVQSGRHAMDALATSRGLVSEALSATADEKAGPSRP